MNLQAQDYPLPCLSPPAGASASYSFSFERVISPLRRAPALLHAGLQPNRLWHCLPDALLESHAARTEKAPPLPNLALPRLPGLPPAVTEKVDRVGKLLAISPARAICGAPHPMGTGDPIPRRPSPAAEPVRGNLRLRPDAGAIRPEAGFWGRDPDGLLNSAQSSIRFAESPLLREDWPVIGGGVGLVPAPLLEWQIERDRERRRIQRKPSPQPAKSIILPDREPEATPNNLDKRPAVPSQITKGMKRWLAVAASAAFAAFGATRYGPSAIDSLNKSLEPRAAFVFFDDPSTGVGPWWPPENFIETADRTFTVNGLALNVSTIGRGDLRFDFDVKLGSGGVGWVAGARDESNYLAYRLMFRGRRKKEYVLLRYPVVEGQPDANRRDEFPVSADLFADDFNRITVRVRDDKLTVLINGQGVDYWTNPRAVRGGVGFFAEKGDSPSLRSVRVDGNDDFAGLMARGTIDTLKSVREMLAGDAKPDQSLVNDHPEAAGPTD